MIWLGLIFLGSTDVLSAEHTSRIIAPLLHWLKPDISAAAIAQIQFFVRKCAHVIEYAVLAMLLWRGLRRGTNLQLKAILRLRSGQALFITVWLAAAIFAMTDEFHQSFVPSRTASPGDVMIDISGALIGLAICWAFATRRRSEN